MNPTDNFNTFSLRNQIFHSRFLLYNEYTINEKAKEIIVHIPMPTLESAKKTILDMLFPVYCVSCHKEKGGWICKNCLEKIKLTDFQVCPACETQITDRGILCPACRILQKSRLDSLITAISYENNAVKKLIYNLKYHFIPSIASLLGEIITKSLLANNVPVPDFLVPVPLHPKRLRWRGFNQSLLIAETISEKLVPMLKVEVLDILERKKYNRAQMKIKNYKERRENVKDIFGLRPDADPKQLQGKIVMLVDDIATTGATLEECAMILKSAGARKVLAAVVARQNIKK